MARVLGSGPVKTYVKTGLGCKGLWLCVVAAFFSTTATAATGDIGQPTVSADGCQLTFTLEGMSGETIAGFEAGKTANLHLISAGYSETIPGTVSRTVQTLFRSASGASPATVTLDLVDWVHSGDSAVTLDIDAGAFSDGASLSTGLTGAVVANSSTLDFAMPSVAIVSEVLTKHSDSFYVDVYACGPAYSEYRSEFGIAAVTVEVTDAGGTGTTVTKTATAMQLVDRIGSYGWQSRWQAFRVGPFNPDAGGDWGPGGAALGLAKVVAKAYPRVGDASSVRTTEPEHVFLDKDNSYQVRHAVVNPLAGDDATGRIGTGDGGFSLATDQIEPAAKNSPYKDIHAALSACQRGDGTTAGPDHGKASWSVVYLAAGSHMLGSYDYGTRTDTRDGPAILTRLPSAARADVVLTGSSNSCGLRTNALWLEDLRIAATGDCVLRTKSQLYYPAGPLGDLECLKIRNCDLVGTGRTDAAFNQWTEGFDKVLAYAISCTDSRRPLVAIRDSSYAANGGGFAAVQDNMVLANHDISIDGSGLATPACVLRFCGANENVSLHNNLIRNIVNVHPAPFGNGQGKPVKSFAMTMNVQESDGQAPYSQVGDMACESWFLYHNVWADGFEYRQDSAVFSQKNVWTLRNVFADMGAVNGADVRPTGHVQNHNINASGFSGGQDWTLGGDMTTLFVDPNIGNYTPKGADLFGRWSDPMAPYDAAGAPMPYDGSGAIGALQSAVSSGTEPTDRTAPVVGTMSALPAFIRSVPLTLEYNGASDGQSGLAGVELWARKGNGPWAATGITSTAASGTLSYNGFSGDDQYGFAIRAADVAGNLSPVPGGAGTVQTTLDTTVPVSGTLVVAPQSPLGPVALQFSGASDLGSGLKQVALWFVKDATGAWTDSGLRAQTASGTFEFVPSGDGGYSFCLQAEDLAGNLSGVPGGSAVARTMVDSTAPLPGTLTVAPYYTTSPVALTFSGVSDSGSGIKHVALWYVKGATGPWTDTGLRAQTASGTFEFVPSGDGDYAFCLQTEDLAGNLSAAPGSGSVARTTVDSTAPIAGSLTVAPNYTTTPVALTFSGVSDSGSGIREVALWFVKDATGTWTDSGLRAQTVSGTFEFVPSGDGGYSFCLQAEDLAGNLSGVPGGSAVARTTVDSIAPVAGALTVAPYYTTSPVALTFSGVADSGSGIKEVALWYTKDATGAWTDSGLRAQGDTGEFEFLPSADGIYHFALQVEDQAGNKSAAPTGTGQCSTIRDSVPPSPGTLSAPKATKRMPLTIKYNGVSDTLSGVKHVILWMKVDSGAWTDSGLRNTASPNGSFSIDKLSEGKYSFFIQAEDKAGLRSPAP